ncbi:MAG: 4a-hydroxytetrahydrobiopterin dehydratase [Planctomycetota bacterium]|nr:4a-hydroxytetrahydrobiopterin dehydratase [Planctomycetota bacterium]
MERLDQEAIDAGLADLSGWHCVDAHHLVKRFEFSNFVEAQAFVNAVGDAAEAQDHHPELRFGWGYAEVEVYTHSAGGITAKDFRLAASADAAYDA